MVSGPEVRVAAVARATPTGQSSTAQQFPWQQRVADLMPRPGLERLVHGITEIARARSPPSPCRAILHLMPPGIKRPQGLSDANLAIADQISAQVSFREKKWPGDCGYTPLGHRPLLRTHASPARLSSLPSLTRAPWRAETRTSCRGYNPDRHSFMNSGPSSRLWVRFSTQGSEDWSATLSEPHANVSQSLIALRTRNPSHARPYPP